jgi:hypothetical protein
MPFLTQKCNMEESKGKILIYKSERGDIKIDVYFANGELWLTQRALSELYQVNIPTVNEHIKNIIREGELDAEATIRNFLIVQTEGQRRVSRDVQHLSFKMSLAVGYRVRSRMGMHFRNWASGILIEYSQKGFVMNDERLKNPKPFGADYFDELLERIRDIRASEKRFYEKIKAIYATSADYDSQDEMAKLFFKTAQNKMHYSIHGHTAAEIIATRADSSKDNMGLTSFKGAKARKGDIDIAKNYLSEDEIRALNRIVTMYLDYAEDQAAQHIPMYMADWDKKLNDFLTFTGRKVLDNAGNVSAEQALFIAEREYELFDQHRKQQENTIDFLVNETKRLNEEKE